MASDSREGSIVGNNIAFYVNSIQEFLVLVSDFGYQHGQVISHQHARRKGTLLSHLVWVVLV